MNIIAHQVFIRDPLGSLLAVLPDGAFTALSYALRENEPGVLELGLPPDFDLTLLPIDGMIEVYRKYGAGSFQLEGSTAFFMRKPEIATTESGVSYIHVTAYSACELLKRRIVAYAAGTAQAEKAATPWDDMLREIMRENYGSLATDTTRNLAPFLTIQADLSLGSSSNHAMPWRVVLNTMQDIVNDAASRGQYGAFDVVLTSPGVFEFQVFINARGNDHSSTSADAVVISEDRHNLGSPKLTHNWENESNYIYCTGQGQGEDRIVKTAQDDARIGISPFNRREFNRDARQSSVDASIQADADAALEENRPLLEFTGKILQTESCIYGIHWAWGDIVTAEFLGQSFDCHVEAVDVGIAENGTEIVQAYLRSVQDVA